MSDRTLQPSVPRLAMFFLESWRTQSYPTCAFLDFEESSSNRALITRETCIPRAAWDGSSMQRKNLLLEAAVWLNFISYHLLPNSKLSSIKFPTLALIFCIMKSHHIDIGRIIEKKIRELASFVDAKRVSVWFASTITIFCRQTGVDIDIDEEPSKAIKSILNDALIQHIISFRGVPPDSPP